MSELRELVDRSPLVRELRTPLGPRPTWLVGGSVRDLALGRELGDIDLVVEDEVEPAARSIAKAQRGHAFPLSEEFGAWRVVPADHAWQADLTPLRERSIEADLALRDFTVNAMAVPLQDGSNGSVAGELIDPYGGLEDLRARLLKVVGERAYTDDPLRTLRLSRFACELGFDVDARTLSQASEHAHEIERVASERVFYELRRLIASQDPVRGVELMDGTGLVAVVLPELAELKDVEQNPYHQFDVWDHSLEVLRQLVDLERDLAGTFATLGAKISEELDRTLSDELTRGQALRFAALFHDSGKPATRSVAEDGRVLFWGHDEVGAQLSTNICRRLHASSALGDYLSALARHHLRPGFLVHERPLSRGHLYRYMRACEPVEVEVTLLSVADRLATQGPKTKPSAIEGHLDVAQELMQAALNWRVQGPPDPPIGGDELMDLLGLQSGPEVGRILEALREATYAGEIATREQALELARRELATD